MTQNKKRNILYALSVGCICVAGFLLLMRHQGETRQMQTQQTVVVTSGGFEPAMLTLRLGSEVLFFNRSNVDVWPASDLHPTHGLYPEFDSKRPVEHGQGWNFQFNKSGKWKYHDHLHPEIIGEIIVLDESGSAVTEVDCNLSLRIPECYQLELQRLTQERGASAALDKIVEWYGSDNQFALDCHGYTHIVGKAAFRRFSQNETLDMGENFRACGYGFFHGFIEAFVQEHGTVDGSREFCLDVSQVSNIDNINKSYIACFHGIGHGLVDGSDPRDYGDSQRFIDDGLKICDQVGVNYREKYLCASGVFNSLAIAYNEPKYKLDFDADIPYNICGVQQADFAKEGCYEEMNTFVMRLSRGNLKTAVEMAKKIPEEKYRVVAVQNLSPVAVSNVESANISELVDACLSLPKELSFGCLTGLVGGLLEHGKPGEEYVKAQEVCTLKKLDTLSRQKCFEYYFASVRFLYQPDILSRACEILPSKFKMFCPKG